MDTSLVGLYSTHRGRRLSVVQVRPRESLAVTAIQDRLLYTVRHAAELLDVSENTVWNLLQRGELHGVKVGRSRKITAAELKRYVSSLADGSAA
jgi:excisionase family DNA binding protein